MSTALVVGATAGIGQAIARRLLAEGWTVVGIGRREATIAEDRYRHVRADVQAPSYRTDLVAALDGKTLDVCIYATGIGRELDISTFAGEASVFATNLVGMAVTAEVVIPRMIAARAGHFVGLSSQADRLIDDYAPSYAASKAGMSAYLEGLALACRPHGVAVTNIRFGFVDTEMSRAQPSRPFLITAERAATLVERCLRRRPIRFTHPWRMAVVLWLLGLGRRMRVWLS
ncbi:MAG: SDR family NAD(P)-dependent oxidoreductase [Deltaproteobacteria bacterium]|nr:SDR family NAD(P)-dependent oxidoreductase [Deltaproteobacteria bacterium]